MQVSIIFAHRILSYHIQQGKSSVYIYTQQSYPTRPIMYNPRPLSRSPPRSPKPSRKAFSPTPYSYNNRDPVTLKSRTSSPIPKTYQVPNSNNFLTTCFLTLGRPKLSDNTRSRGGKEMSEEALNLEVSMNAPRMHD